MRKKPKFKVGQVVMRNDGPIKIEHCSFYPGENEKGFFLYGGQGKEAWQSELRPQTRREKG